MKTVRRDDNGNITHVRDGNDFITLEEQKKKFEALADIEDSITLPHIMRATIVLTGIDLTMLRRQKHELVQINRDLLDKRQNDALEGILCLCDAIQDYAVDNLGMDKKSVFFMDAKPRKMKPVPPAPKVLLTINEGLVQCIESNRKDIKIAVVNYDDEADVPVLYNIQKPDGYFSDGEAYKTMEYYSGDEGFPPEDDHELKAYKFIKRHKF